jgi:hypothetical protein
MGFVLVVAPWVQVRTHLLLGPKVSEPLHFAAFWLLAPWIVVELLTLPYAAITRVAVAAHVGGFAAGAAVGAVLRHPRLAGTPWYVDPAPPGGGPAGRRRLRRVRVGSSRGVPPGTNAPTGHGVLLRGLGADTSRVAVAKLLLVHAGVEPEDGMALLADVAAGKASAVTCPDADASRAFVAKARALGVDLTEPGSRSA